MGLLTVQVVSVLIYVVYCVSACYHSTVTDREVCTSFDELDAEGKDTWVNAIVQRGSVAPRIVLREDSFIRTPNLKELSVHGLVKEIEPGAFKSLENLDKLIIFDNDFETLHPGIFIGLNIRQVIFTNNNMKTIPQEFFKHVPKIRIVSIDKNDIREVKAGVYNGTSIVKVYLQGNGIETIEDGAFANMQSLRYLNIPGNKLSTFDSKLILGDCPSLYSLTLNKNNFEAITKSMLATIPNLEQFFIQLNKIHTIEKDSFSNVPRLEFLELGNNNLKLIKKNLFPKGGMKNMKVLFIHNNKLTFLDLALFIRLPYLQFLTYAGNPLQCACLKELRVWIAERNVKVLCADEFYADRRPKCLVSPVSISTCIYDVDLNKNLIQMYSETLERYTKVPLVCDTIHGFANASLRNREY